MLISKVRSDAAAHLSLHLCDAFFEHGPPRPLLAVRRRSAVDADWAVASLSGASGDALEQCGGVDHGRAPAHNRKLSTLSGKVWDEQATNMHMASMTCFLSKISMFLLLGCDFTRNLVCDREAQAKDLCVVTE